MLGSDHLRRDGEVLVEVLDVQFRSCGLSDAQTSAIIGGQDDGADLMGLESVAHTCPGRVDALAEQGLFDRDQQMIGKHTKKDMRVCGVRDGGRSAGRRAAISCRGRHSRRG